MNCEPIAGMVKVLTLIIGKWNAMTGMPILMNTTEMTDMIEKGILVDIITLKCPNDTKITRISDRNKERIPEIKEIEIKGVRVIAIARAIAIVIAMILVKTTEVEMNGIETMIVEKTVIGSTGMSEGTSSTQSIDPCQADHVADTKHEKFS